MLEVGLSLCLVLVSIADLRNSKRIPAPKEKLDPSNDPFNKIEKAYRYSKRVKKCNQLNFLEIIFVVFSLGTPLSLLAISLTLMTEAISWDSNWKLRRVLS